jgi:hypothetical protein
MAQVFLYGRGESEYSNYYRGARKESLKMSAAWKIKLSQLSIESGIVL